MSEPENAAEAMKPSRPVVEMFERLGRVVDGDYSDIRPGNVVDGSGNGPRRTATSRTVIAAAS